MNKLHILIATIVILFSSSVFAQKSGTTNAANVLSKVWNKVSSALPQKELTGTWNFKSTACMFETENLLKKAGGAVVATQVEKKFNEYCAKSGIQKENTQFVFNADSTYIARLGKMKFSGNYSINPETKQISLSYMRGLGKLDATPVVSGKNMKLMFDADGFLKLMKTLSMFTKDNSIEILAAMDDMYDGMLLGFDMNKN
ncbi:MAG: DUF4923 family protein [Dysgonamonadaceae bacterium]